jgi:aerobic-type carbon monoxide dehydrogenase small subunit (CoxS/CutS family)
MSISLKVNNKTYTAEVDPRKPLLWVLRDDLGLVGTKFGCGRGLCGACTVHLDGKAMRSCILPVRAAAKREITTIEGLADANGDLHPLQTTWIEDDVPQCGYCQSGQLMAAAALLKETPQPDAKQIEKAMQGNLCRCGTYPRIKSAIAKVAAKGGAA